ncbi:MAG: hypothetical protein UR21_C0005G0007 [Candidatus Woesebacteria bacterium GW2011_GWC2_31_9]|uniref:Uncharacterized protein n=1 Tax=Candidatus Woesebacteria bacterium GW2011_GWC2_31_9 TaxID=1618586 RepID=A0A0G0AZ09_9BACT|nr:MAG: hypothetical protein UR21_C0005G0007 [Candidatus Woesebacteria bacterium GW2011_GWC2_31_9]
MKQKLFIIIFAIFLVSLIIYSKFIIKNKSNIVLDTQTNSEGSVIVEITPPQDILENFNIWRFSVNLNTHSIELTEDLTKISVLIDDKGKIYNPESWDEVVFYYLKLLTHYQKL